MLPFIIALLLFHLSNLIHAFTKCRLCSTVPQLLSILRVCTNRSSSARACSVYYTVGSPWCVWCWCQLVMAAVPVHTGPVAVPSSHNPFHCCFLSSLADWCCELDRKHGFDSLVPRPDLYCVAKEKLVRGGQLCGA